MSPRESWLAIAKMGTVHMPTHHSNGARLRDIDAEEPEYRGIPIHPNLPIVRGGALNHFGANAVLGYSLS